MVLPLPKPPWEPALTFGSLNYQNCNFTSNTIFEVLRDPCWLAIFWSVFLQTDVEASRKMGLETQKINEVH